MIQQLNNWLDSISTYADMSPDHSIRRQVNKRMALSARDALSIGDWCNLFATYSHDGSPFSEKDRAVVAFVSACFSDYSGLDFSLVRPHDRLHNDLHFALVCWHDWVITFCEDFYQCFEIDLSDYFDEDDFETIGDLINFLVRYVRTSDTQAANSTAAETKNKTERLLVGVR
ncbi:MAG: hypothetical protein AAFY72_08400 [Cyanobacteria bacterium J06649_4]